VELDALRVDDANRVKAECLYAGGKGIDVSRALHRLGGVSIALGFIGGHNGQLLLDLLKQDGIIPHFTPIAGETRRDIILNVASTGRQTLLNSRGPVIRREEWRSFLEHLTALDLRDASVAMGGSLPRGVPVDAYAQIIELVQSRGARAFLDADGPALRAGLKAKPFGIKPNVNELRRLVGRPLRTERDIVRTAEALQRAGIETVLVSRGRQGMLVIQQRERLKAVPPPVRVRSTVGAGDSCVAGFVLQDAGGKTLEDAVRLATAAGTAATLAPGNQLCRLKDVERLARRVQVSAIAN
jgi:6-phosphofructokinase 2